MANKRLNATLTIGGALSSSFRSVIGTATSHLNKVGDAVRRLSAEQKTLGGAIQTFGRLGKDVDGLRARYAAVTAELERMRRAQERLRGIHTMQQNNLSRRAELRGGMFEAVAVGATTALPVVAAAKFETAMLGVAKQVEGARDDAGKLTPVYAQFGKEIQHLGREIPIATNELAGMVTAGARMGVAKDELIEFTRQTAKMAEAFESTDPADLADKMGKIATLYKIPIPAIGQLGDTINYLDDNAISKGADIIDFLTRTGGVAASVKVTGQQMAALGSTLLTMGERTETASTAVNAMFQKFAAADKGTKKFKAAMKEIGLSSAAVQKGMQVDAQGTLLKVLDAVGKLKPEKRLGVMVELVGLEHSDTMAKLAAGTEEYRKQIALAGSEKAKGSMSREFQARMETTEAQWRLMKNRATELSVNIGSSLLPALNGIGAALTPGINGLSDFARENKGVTKWVMGSVFAVGALGLAGKAGAYGVTFLKGGLLNVWQAATRVQTAVAPLAARVIPALLNVVRPLGLAFAVAGAPLWALVAGGTALVAAGVAVWKYWEPIKAFFGGFGAAVVQGFAPVGEAFTAAFRPAWDVIKPLAMPVLEWIGAKVQAIGGWFRDLLTPIGAASDTTKAWGDAGKLAGEAVAIGFRIALTPIEMAVRLITWLRDNIGGVAEKISSAGAALKERVFGGGPTPPALPPMASRAGGGGGTVTNQNTFQITQQPGESQQALAKRVADELERRQRVNRGSRLYDGATN